MREFFKGWRRKAGCLVLLMSIVLLCGWFRSMIVTDQLEVAIGDSNHFFTSTEGYFRWTRWEVKVPGVAPWVWHSVAHGSPGQPLDNESAVQWRWNWFLFDFGSGLFRGSPLSAWAFPYWIGIPLTGVAAALLIPGPSKGASDEGPDRAG